MGHGGLGGAARVEPAQDSGNGYLWGGDDRAQFPSPSKAIGSGGPGVKAGGEGGRTRLRRKGWGERGCTRCNGGGRLQSAPEVDTSQVLVPDSTKAEDDEVLDFNDRLDGSVTTPGGVLLME